MKYFVLKPKGRDIYAQSSRRAMRSYAKLIQSKNPTLASELTMWADREFANAFADEEVSLAGEID